MEAIMPDIADVLKSFGIVSDNSGAASGQTLNVRSPIDGRSLAAIRTAGPADIAAAIDRADEAFKTWQLVPAPRRGEFVRRIGQELRRRKAELATLVSWEVGK